MKRLCDHPVYQKIISTGLFQEPYRSEMRNSGSFYFKDGPTKYSLGMFLFADGEFAYELVWQRHGGGGTFFVNFEEVLENVSPALQEKLLFHLDLLICKQGFIKDAK